MLSTISQTRAIGGWIATVIVAFAFSVFGGAELSVGAGQLWMVMCFAPPAVMLLLWHDTAALATARTLYADHSASKEGRR